MKLLLPLLGMLLLAGCSKPTDQSPADRQANAKPLQFHRYVVTFAAVKAPNELLLPYTTNSVGPDSIKVRYQIASYLLAHTNDFPIITPEGNFVPVVTTGHGTGGRFVLDDKREAAELEKTGIKLTGLEMNMDVNDEDDQGSVWYEGMAGYNVDVNATSGYGGDIPFPGGLLPVGQADLQPLYTGKNFTLCALVKLARAN
ncbi:MAG TPA: hypothetical protein VGN23_03960 [Verrucomicrobiae bacterium]|jgi:hypothetical protein